MVATAVVIIVLMACGGLAALIAYIASESEK
jgi:hypothetical protein